MSNPTVTLIPQAPVFTLQFGDKTLRDLRQVSEWEQFIKLVDGKGLQVILLDRRGPLTKSLAGIGEKFGIADSAAQFDVIAASPAFFEFAEVSKAVQS